MNEFMQSIVDTLKPNADDPKKFVIAAKTVIEELLKNRFKGAIQLAFEISVCVSILETKMHNDKQRKEFIDGLMEIIIEGLSDMSRTSIKTQLNR